DRARIRRPVQLNLHLHLVHRARVVVEGDPELAHARELAQDLLYRGRKDVHPADHDHVVAAAQHAAGQPAPQVARWAGLRLALHHVARAVADGGEPDAAQSGDHELAELAVRHRLTGLRVHDLGDQLVLRQVQAAVLGARVGDRADLGEPRVVVAAGIPQALDLRADAR